MPKQKTVHSLWFWRKQKGLTETELGDAVGVHMTSIRRWQKDPTIIPLAMAYRLAETLNIDVKQIDYEHNYKDLGEDIK